MIEALTYPYGTRHTPDMVADLSRRAVEFRVQVLRCARCGNARRILAEVTEPDAVKGILEHLGLPLDTEGPVPTRGPPLADLPWAS